MKLALACLLSLLIALPVDAQNIWNGLFHPDLTATWKLSLGLSLKVLMGVLSILGLWRDSTFGYTFLLGSSALNLIMRGGELSALEGVWEDHLGQLVQPLLESFFRLFCLGYLGLHWRRMLGLKEVSPCDLGRA